MDSAAEDLAHMRRREVKENKRKKPKKQHQLFFGKPVLKNEKKGKNKNKKK